MEYLLDKCFNDGLQRMISYTDCWIYPFHSNVVWGSVINHCILFGNELILKIGIKKQITMLSFPYLYLPHFYHYSWMLTTKRRTSYFFFYRPTFLWRNNTMQTHLLLLMYTTKASKSSSILCNNFLTIPFKTTEFWQLIVFFTTC